MARAGLLTGALYFAASRYMEVLADPVSAGAVFWPGAGVSVAALLLTPTSWWPLLLAAVAGGELASNALDGYPLANSMLWAVAKVVVALSAAGLVRRCRAESLADTRSIVVFGAFAVVLGPLLGGLLAAPATVALDSTHSYLAIVVRWAVGDALGVLTVAPVGLVLLRDREASRQLLRPEAIVLMAAATITSIGVFWLSPWELLLPYLVFLPLLWAAIRYGTAGAAATSFLVSHTANIAAAFGQVPWMAWGPEEGAALWLLQVYLLTATYTTLMIGARTREGRVHLALLGAARRDAQAERASRAESEQLAASQRFARLLLDSTGDGIYGLDLDDRCTFANPACIRLLGYEDEGELLGRRMHDLIHRTRPDGSPYPAAECRNSQIRRDGGEVVGEDEMLVRKDGAMLPVEYRSYPVREDGVVTGSVVTFTDITARRRDEAELERVHALQRLAGGMAGLGGWSIDVAADQVTWTDEMFAIFEHPGEQAPEREEVHQLYAAEHRARIDAAVDACAAEGVAFDIELELRTYRGRMVWVRAMGEPRYDDDGAVTHVIGAFQDVTALKEAAEEARLLAERYSTTLESITDAFFTLDRDWRFTYVNHQAERLLRRTREALLGQRIWEEFAPLVGTEAERGYRRAIEEDVTVVLDDFYYEPLHGWFQINAYPSPQGLAVYFREITALKMAQEKLSARLGQEKAVAELASVALLIDDPDELLDHAAKAVAAILEVPHVSILGPGLEDDAFLAMSAPIRTPRRAYGTIGVHATGTRDFTEDEHVLVRSVAGILGSAIGRLEAESDLREQALCDPLTGLANRTLLLDRTRKALAKLPRTGGTVAVLFLDLDNFKPVNDSLGHDAGDAVLAQIGSRLEAVLRPPDTLARFGGDEFVILCDALEEPRDARLIAERVLDTMAEPYHLGDRPLQMTASVGVATATEPIDATELLRKADVAMYGAKERGRARVELFDDDLRARADRRLETQLDLRDALDRGEFRLAYQPQVATEGGHITGAEALLRWEHPTRGLLTPGDFLEVAEKTGLIAPIGAWVRERAIRQLAAWDRQGTRLARLAVNLSSRDLADTGFATELAELLAAHRIDPHRLSVEVTETAILHDTDAAYDTLEALSGLGMTVALDDFGTGYSSLRHLHELPVDIVKIDRTFVMRLDRNTGGNQLVAGTLAMLSTMGLDAIAEGVETRGQLHVLRQLGCSTAQGYLFSPPVPPAELAPLLHAGVLAPQLAPSAA